MNTHAKVADISRDAISPAEWQARVDLAAVYRLVAHYGWDDVIYNHSSMRNWMSAASIKVFISTKASRALRPTVSRP